MKSLNKSRFDSMIHISPNNIMDGFNNYNNAILTFNEEYVGNVEDRFFKFIEEIYRQNKRIVVDYYGCSLSDNDFERMVSELEDSEKTFLKNIREKNNRENIYFEVMNLETLKLLMKLSVRSVLFSTFYFFEDNITIWSNYDYKFVVFFNNINDLENYKNIAKNSELLIKDIKILNN